MKYIFRFSFLIAITCFHTVSGQSVKSDKVKLPGDTTLPSSEEQLKQLALFENQRFSYSIEDYFLKPQTSDIELHPDGNSISYWQKDSKGKRKLYLKNLKTAKIQEVLKEKEEVINSYQWLNHNRLLYTYDTGGDENYRIFAVNRDGSRKKALTPFQGVSAYINSRIEKDTNSVIILMNKDNPETFEPYKLNVLTGALKKLFSNSGKKNPAEGFSFDSKGRLRAYTIRFNGTMKKIMYRSPKEKSFRLIQTCSWKDVFEIIAFDDNDLSGNSVYVKSNLGRDKSVILLYDMKKNRAVKTLFEQDSFDAGDIEISAKRKNVIDYYTYKGQKNEIVPQSEYFKKIYNRFLSKFENYQVDIISKSKNEKKYLLKISSDRLYGQYYQYDVEKDSFELLLDLMPKLKESDMAEMRPIHFTSRDGLTIYGYLTIPKGASKDHQVPLIVNPHGGPYGERDEWRFNAETQLFASRGYATLQIDYRGSGGYGKNLLLKGSKQIGRNMLNDLEDGVAFAIGEEFINKNKIAIYGASYGGLAALGSLVKTPDLYTCAVSYVGVSNLFTFVESFPAYWKPLLKQFYEQWYDPEFPEEKQIMTDVSPALNIDKIKTPLFIVQGANDPRVNINESDQIVKSLRNRGVDIPYMVRYNEGHGFQHEVNRVTLYKTMMGFFAKHLKQ